MSNPFNGSKHGKRGVNNTNRASRVDYIESKGISTAVLVENSAIYYDCARIEETEETHVVPRKSLTNKLHLKLIQQSIEVLPIKTRQLDHSDPNGVRMIKTTNNRLVWKSDKNLLRMNKPATNNGVNIRGVGAGYVRVTSSSKRRKFEVEELPEQAE